MPEADRSAALKLLARLGKSAIGEAKLPVSLDPIIERPPLLVAHCAEVSPQPWFRTAAGDRVVTLDALKSDLLGTRGWRPDLLTRLEALYPATGADDAG